MRCIGLHLFVSAVMLVFSPQICSFNSHKLRFNRMYVCIIVKIGQLAGLSFRLLMAAVKPNLAN